ncbi:hypothetical protein [Rhabdaerophilum sp. SD176]|uniref:hypothetical protein n=1 Tax=Rhabdaerophilum sp. SD176 TaxID=2983548 RepID=UPI0024DFD4EC|nr:hypothetical protein [Rhabdaerophilum sp. SD176]
MRRQEIWLETGQAARAAMLLGILFLVRPALGQTPPQAGWSLSTQFGPGWTSNPNDLPGRQKGDAYWAMQLGLGYRQPLWDGAALAGILGTGADWYARERDAGSNRLFGSLSFTQAWRGATLSLGVTARTSMDQPLRAHDDASQDVSLGLSRAITLAPDWTLIPSLGAARRFYQNGTKNDIRFRSGLVLARKWNAWTWRLGGTASYLLEDNTPILPRIRDRSWSLFLSSTYEWEKDREIGLRLAYARTYSSYAPNRFRSIALAPQVSATFRF